MEWQVIMSDYLIINEYDDNRTMMISRFYVPFFSPAITEKNLFFEINQSI